MRALNKKRAILKKNLFLKFKFGAQCGFFIATGSTLRFFSFYSNGSKFYSNKKYMDVLQLKWVARRDYNKAGPPFPHVPDNSTSLKRIETIKTQSLSLSRKMCL